MIKNGDLQGDKFVPVPSLAGEHLFVHPSPSFLNPLLFLSRWAQESTKTDGIKRECLQIVTRCGIDLWIGGIWLNLFISKASESSEVVTKWEHVEECLEPYPC